MSKEEEKWIDRLQKLMDSKPKSIWFFNNGTMFVMRYKDDGTVAMENNAPVQGEYLLTTISNVHSEGGDW